MGRDHQNLSLPMCIKKKTKKHVVLLNEKSGETLTWPTEKFPENLKEGDTIHLNINDLRELLEELVN